MNRSVKISAPLMSLSLFLGACGGGGGAKQASPTTGATSATTATTASAGLGGIPGDALLAQRCVNYVAFAGAIGLSLAAAVDPTAAKHLEDLKSKIDFGAAPAEIKGDFAVITAYAEDHGKVLARYNAQGGQPDPQAIAAIAEFSRTVDTARLQKASDNINAWISAHCPR
jgi:hypothetical protein